PVTTAPRTLPRAPAPSTSPSVPGGTSSDFVAYRMRRAKKNKVKKLMWGGGPPEPAPHDRAPEDPAAPRHDMALPGRLGRRLLGFDAPQKEGRDDVGARADEGRDPRREDLHQQAADARPRDVREGTAPVHDRAALDEVLARHECDEERVVRDVEQHA